MRTFAAWVLPFAALMALAVESRASEQVPRTEIDTVNGRVRIEVDDADPPMGRITYLDLVDANGKSAPKTLGPAAAVVKSMTINNHYMEIWVWCFEFPGEPCYQQLVEGKPPVEVDLSQFKLVSSSLGQTFYGVSTALHSSTGELPGQPPVPLPQPPGQPTTPRYDGPHTPGGVPDPETYPRTRTGEEATDEEEEEGEGGGAGEEDEPPVTHPMPNTHDPHEDDTSPQDGWSDAPGGFRKPGAPVLPDGAKICHCFISAILLKIDSSPQGTPIPGGGEVKVVGIFKWGYCIESDGTTMRTVNKETEFIWPDDEDWEDAYDEWKDDVEDDIPNPRPRGMPPTPGRYDPD